MDASPELTALFERKLDELQFGATERIIVFRPFACGLGGQLTGRVLTLAMALALGRKAVFLGLADPPYGQTFAPLHSSADIGGFEDAPIVALAEDQDARIVLHDPLLMSVHGEPFDQALLAKASARLGVHLPSRAVLEGLAFNWMKVTSEVEAWNALQRERLGVDADTLGVHFRRGDKAVETAFVPASVINAKIAQIHKGWTFSKLFLASDSPTAPQEIVCPPGVTLIFDTQEQRFNNANHKMLMEQPELVEQETLVAFKNIHLLSACGGVVGQDNAHFATLAAASILARGVPRERVTLISGRIAEENNPALAHYFRLKAKARAIARVLFPQLTVKARMERARREAR